MISLQMMHHALYLVVIRINHQHPYTAKQSTAVMKALEDEDSELSRFLLCGKNDEDDDMKRRIAV